MSHNILVSTAERLINNSESGEVSISADGKVAVIGFPYYSEGQFSNCGAILIYEFTNCTESSTAGKWVLIGKKLASDKGSYAQFGGKICISYDGSSIAISAKGDNNGRGAVYYFTKEKDDWVENFKLIQNDDLQTIGYPLFMSMSESGDDLIIGNKYSNDGVIAWCISLYEITEEPRNYRQLCFPENYELLEGKISPDGKKIAFCFITPSEQIILEIFKRNENAGSIEWINEKNIVASHGPSNGVGIRPALALSYDGRTVAITKNSGKEIAIYTEEAGEWASSCSISELSITDRTYKRIHVSQIILSYDGKILAIGLPYDVLHGVAQGSIVRINTLSSNQRQTLISNPARTLHGLFGKDIAMAADGLRIVANSAFEANEISSQEGIVHVFDV